MINKRITILVLISLILWFSFTGLIYMRPSFWKYYTQVSASPFIISKPNNETIYAAPCIIEITEPYFKNYTCNMMNIIYTTKILTCPEGYFCDSLDNRKVCILNNTYYCHGVAISGTCLDITTDDLGVTLINNEALDSNNTIYIIYIILVSILCVLELVIFTMFYLINWYLYSKQYRMNKFHGSWFALVSIIYYINLTAIPVLTYVLIPDVASYKQCYDMSLIMFSTYGIELAILLFIIMFGSGTIIYLFILFSMSRYLQQNEEHEKLLQNSVSTANNDGFFL